MTTHGYSASKDEETEAQKPIWKKWKKESWPYRDSKFYFSCHPIRSPSQCGLRHRGIHMIFLQTFTLVNSQPF